MNLKTARILAKAQNIIARQIRPCTECDITAGHLMRCSQWKRNN